MICRAGRTDSRSFNAGVRERSVSQGCDPPLLSNSPRRLFDGESSGRWGNRVRDSEQRQEEPRASLSLLKRHSFFPRTCLGTASRNPLHARVRWGSRRVLQSSLLCGGKALAGTCVVPGSVPSVPQAEMSAASSSCHAAPELARSIAFPVMLSLMLNLFLPLTNWLFIFM